MGRRVELLAPAGNPEGFYGAIHAGADAVYLGGERFGARAYADNFTSEELIQCIRYAHIHGRRVYLTVNTLVKETEFPDIFDFLNPFYTAGLDGVIVQDIGVFAYIRDTFPDMELHVSTQMTLTGEYGASLLKEMGASRIVPARELSLEEIRSLKESTGLEVETFIHGAMCYCYSGQCLFSSILGGRSGNRGRCAQPCRLPYQLERNGQRTAECYPLSLKDMCTIDHIPALIEAGIDSFKIEGRMKKPEYTAGVTAIYRKYIDQYYSTGACKVSEQDRKNLKVLYIRSELQDGYYYKHHGRDMLTLSSPSYSGSDDELLAKIRQKYLSDRPKMPVTVKANLLVGQKAEVQMTLDAGRIPFDEDKTSHSPLSVLVRGEEVSLAVKQPVSRENIAKQMGKLGDTSFVLQSSDISLSDKAFYPLKSLNELRRQAVRQLENLCIEAQGLPVAREQRRQQSETTQSAWKACPADEGTMAESGALHVCVKTLEQLQAVAEWIENRRKSGSASGISRVCLEADLLTDHREKSLGLCRELQSNHCTLLLAFPAILRLRDAAWLEEIWRRFTLSDRLFAGFMVRSLDGLGFLLRKGRTLENSEMQNPKAQRFFLVFGDSGLYAWNLRTLEEYAKYLDGFCLPLELKAADQHKLQSGGALSCEKIIYGRIPLMVTANCVADTIDGCQSERTSLYYLVDRYKKRFPVMRNCRHCMNTVYNSVPLSLHKEFAKWQKGISADGENSEDSARWRGIAQRLDFTVEDRQDTLDILKYFVDGADGGFPLGEYTAGHEKRGAE